MSIATTVPTAPRPTRPSRGPAMVVAGIGAVVLGVGGFWAYDHFSSTSRQVIDEITAPTSSLAIVNEVGDVRVVGTDDTTIRITRTEVSSLSEARTTMAQDGETLRVTGQCTGVGLGSCHVDLVVQVPRSVTVDVSTGSGDVQATGTTGTTIDTGSGNAVATGTTGDTRASTGSGDVTVTDAGSTVRADSGSGDIRISTTIATPITADTASGDITVVVPAAKGPYHVMSHTSSGSTNVAVEQADAGIPLNLTTSSGDIRVNGS